MSFSNDAKTEIIKQFPQKRCCRRALAAGLLFEAETDGERIICTYPSREVAEYARKAVGAVFGRNAAENPAVFLGRNSYDIAITSKEAASFVTDMAESGYDALGSTCGECGEHYIRAIFLASGSVTDPVNQYHLEFLLNDAHRANVLYGYLDSVYGKPSIINRRSGVGLVYKNSGQIEDILSAVGATQSYFALINGKIEREIRNHENRATNCETRNISASVDAAAKQLRAISEIRAKGLFPMLADELRETAELRELYPSLSLTELAARHTPPISKSGLNHRIEKIITFADKSKE